MLTRDPDAVVLDLGLPDVDGERLLGMIRAVSQVPVIVATARDDEGLIVAPARCRSRRLRGQALRPGAPRGAHPGGAATRLAGSDQVIEPPLQVGGLRVDRSRRTAEVDGRPVELTKLEFDLLAYLAENPGRVVSRK